MMVSGLFGLQIFCFINLHFGNVTKEQHQR